MSKPDAPRLIALYSSRPQSGKSTCADALSELGYRKVKFASYLKGMLRQLLAAIASRTGRTEMLPYLDDYIEGHLKESPLPFIPGSPSPRDLMVSLGTGWGRGLVHPDLWIDLTCQEIAHRLCNDELVVVDDLRFVNEYKALKKLGATFVRVERLEPDQDARTASQLVFDRLKAKFRRKSLTTEGQLDHLHFDQVVQARTGKVGYLQWTIQKVAQGRTLTRHEG